MTQEFPILYSRDVKSNILEWRISVINQAGEVSIKLSYGVYGGDHTITYQRDIKGKNKGRSNETTPWEQAIKDAKSKYERKIKTGYISLQAAKDLEEVLDATTPMKTTTFKTLTGDVDDSLLTVLKRVIPKYRLDANNNVKPMKAVQYFKSGKDTYKDENNKTQKRDYWTDPSGKKWSDKKYYFISNPYANKTSKDIAAKFPMMGQPKINGVRCFIKKEGNVFTMTSKEGLIYRVAHILDYLKNKLTVLKDDLILDGELYIHGELLQDIRSAIVKPNLSTPRVKFIIFDLAIEDKTNLERWQALKNLKPILEETLDCPLELISTVSITNDLQAQKYTDLCISKGYEGSIFRAFDAYYGFGTRRVTMIKLKRAIDTEFTIIDVIPQVVDNTKGNFVCITKEGNRFDVTPFGKGDFNSNSEYLQDLLNSPENYIGKKLTIKFYEWTKDLKPMHIIDNSLRDYE